MRLASQSAILVKVWTWNASRNAWKASGGIFDIPQKETRLKELERRLEDPSLWNDPEAARKVSQEAARLRRTVDTFRSLESDLQGLLELMEELPAEEREALKPELEEAAKKLDELYRLAWIRGLKTTYYLRTLAASSGEKSTGRGGELNAVPVAGGMTHGAEAVSAPPATDAKFCSIDNPDCEACQ